jgi:hypothetical protein
MFLGQVSGIRSKSYGVLDVNVARAGFDIIKNPQSLLMARSKFAGHYTYK